MKLTKGIARELFDYNNGLLYFKERPARYFKNDLRVNSWNTRYAGKIVGSTHCSNYKTYQKTSIFDMQFYLHDIVLAWHGIEKPEGFVCDHVNGIGTDNRIENLRYVEPKINQRNLKKKTTNRTGISNVHWDESRKSYIVQIAKKHIKQSKDFFEACCARFSYMNQNGFSERHGR